MTQNMPQKQKTKLVPVLREPALLTERDADKSPVLECIDLGITFGGLKAVDNFNVTIGRTEISGLIGPNGGQDHGLQSAHQGLSAHPRHDPLKRQGYP